MSLRSRASKWALPKLSGVIKHLNGEVFENLQFRNRLLVHWYRSHNDCSPSYAFVAFSKDRPMQLHALLTSYDRSSLNRPSITILYYASDALYQRGYERSIEVFSKEKHLTFVQQQGEKTFQSDLLQILEKTKESRIAFLVDDIVFIRAFDIRDFDKYDLRSYTPSLRLGKTIRYSYTVDHGQRLPPYLVESDSLLSWNWAGGEFDWAYPLSLDGNVFLRSEMHSLLGSFAYSNPNTLEAGLQKFLDLYNNRKGLCYSLPRLVNFPLNLVQKDFPNRHGSISAEDLLHKWLDGLSIDVDALRDFQTDSVHTDGNVTFVKLEK